MDCRGNQRRIEAYFARGLSAPQIADMRAHTTGCVTCQRHYDRAGALEASLCDESGLQPSTRHAERLLVEIVARAELSERAQERGLRWWALRLVPAAALLAGVVLPVALWRAQPQGVELSYGSHSFQVKGYADTPQGRHGAGVRAFCLRPTFAGQQVVAVAVEELAPALEVVAPAAVSCPVQGVLFFTATNLLDEARQVFVLGLDPDLQPRWYYPKPEEGRSRSISPQTLDRPLGRGIMIQVNHQPGSHRLFALVAGEEIDVATVERALQGLRASGRDLDEIAELPIGVAAQQLRFDLELQATP